MDDRRKTQLTAELAELGARLYGAGPEAPPAQTGQQAAAADRGAHSTRVSPGGNLGRVRGSALWLWCNGRFAGYLAAGADESRMDLTGRLEPGSNALAFRVDGAGGLALPPFVFRPAGE